MGLAMIECPSTRTSIRNWRADTKLKFLVIIIQKLVGAHLDILSS
jgi:hypothetical protein